MSLYAQELVKNVAGKRYGKLLVEAIYKEIYKQMNVDILAGKRVDILGICSLQLLDAKRNRFINPKTGSRFTSKRKRLYYEVNHTFKKKIRGMCEK